MNELLIAASQLANAYVPLNLADSTTTDWRGTRISDVSEKIGNRVYQTCYHIHVLISI
jgi:hypothetical protein